MVIKYPAEKVTPRRSILYDQFLSVDFARASSSVAAYNSPDALNMIRDEYGKVRKRMGYTPKLTYRYTSGGKQYGRRIWGITKYKDKFIVHADTYLYETYLDNTDTQHDTLLYSAMAEAPSQFYQNKGKLYILDGSDLICYDATVTPATCASVDGHVPKVTIGGTVGYYTNAVPPVYTEPYAGVKFEQFNLITNKYIQSFAGVDENYIDNGHGHFVKNAYFQTASFPLDSSAGVKVYCGYTTGDDDGYTWTELDDTHIYVDYSTGIIQIDANTTTGLNPYTWVGEPLVVGQDNIRIEVTIDDTKRDSTTTREKITKCKVAKGFGINGYDNQLFVANNDDNKCQLYWSEIDKIEYWPDLQYAALGQDDSKIVSLSSMGAYLVAHKDSASRQHYLCNVGIKTVNDYSTVQLSVEKVIIGSGCVCPYGSQNFGEPLFVTETGIQALTYRDLTNQEIETIRGDRVNARLLTEDNLQDAVTAVYKYFYLFAVNDHIYILDRLNPQEELNVLSNAYQYNAFYFEHVPAKCWYVDGDDLLFGTGGGKTEDDTNAGCVMVFYHDDADGNSYNDNGETYDWRWTFPEYVGSRFYNNKSIKFIALRAKAYLSSTVTIDLQRQGIWWEEVVTDTGSFGYFDFSNIDFGNFNFSTDTTPKKASEKVNENKLDKFSFRVRGNTINEPFGLYSFAFEVKEKGKHKN